MSSNQWGCVGEVKRLGFMFCIICVTVPWHRFHYIVIMGDALFDLMLVFHVYDAIRNVDVY